MAVGDMDISLNVTSNPAAGASKLRKHNASGTKKALKRLKGSILHKQKVSGENSTTNQTKARVKQKSLSTIVGSTLKASKASVVQKSPTSPSTHSQNSVPASNAHNGVCFIKNTQENCGKTLLAKKRPNADTKKSLSEIFLKTTRPEGLLPSFQNFVEKQSIEEPKKQKLEGRKNQEKHSRNFGSDGRLNKKQKVEFQGKKENVSISKQGGKISSLFGNNPEVPNIGQRLVKPINEPVFTKLDFTDLNVHPFMVSNLEQNLGIATMTIVQQKAIPQVLSGKDVLIRSQTGSGKTLSYALPIVELLQRIRPKLSRSSGLKALIVVPTRELVLQTYEFFLKLVKPFTWIVPGYLLGGEKRKAEKARLRKGCNILVATPGRLLDHIKHTTALKLHEVRYFVVDEADRMLDMGYEKDMSGIVEALKVTSTDYKSGYDPMQLFRKNNNILTEKEEFPKETTEEKSTFDEEGGKGKEYSESPDDEDEEEENVLKDNAIGCESVSKNAKKETGRQTILLSATLTHQVEKLAGLTMKDPIFVDAAKENLEESKGHMEEVNEDLVVPQGVTQSYIVTPPKLRLVTLSAYIAGKCQVAGEHKILVFMATQDMVDFYTDILSAVLSRPMNEEDEDSDPLVDVEFFKLHGNMSQKERTEVFNAFRRAASGVLLCTDVAARGLDMPKVDTVIQYTGPLSARDYVHRIGRTARAGCSGSATIFLTPPEVEFVRMLESRRIRIRQNVDNVLEKLLGPLSNHGSVQAAAIALQNDFETLLLENKDLYAKACKAYVSWVRFYSSYPRDMRGVFNRREVHLGHFAKSFALRDPPRRIGGIGKNIREKEDKPRHVNRLANERTKNEGLRKRDKHGGRKEQVGLLKRVRMLNTSEYGDGLEATRKPKKF